MAKKRMFSLDVVSTDQFLDMPLRAQALYFHLGMHGDDDGFVANPQMIMRSTGCRMSDMKTLVSSGYVIPFSTGIVAIRDWLLNNDLKNDRYHETRYQQEKALLTLDGSKRYILARDLEPDCIRDEPGSETEQNRT